MSKVLKIVAKLKSKLENLCRETSLGFEGRLFRKSRTGTGTGTGISC